MAVIEISKIQVRRGQENQTGIPLLAGGEFAWAADTESLYIGLKREDGGARDANVRILTENDLRNFFNFTSGVGTLDTSTTYSYRADTEPPITGYYTSTTATAYSRLLVKKLDDVVSIADFGVVGDGTSYVSDKFQFAINRLFLTTATNEDYALTTGTVSAAKALLIPSGHYVFNGPVFLPQNTTLIGEGIGKTIISMVVTGTNLFQTVDQSKHIESSTTPITSWKTFDSETWQNGFSLPASNVHIEGMTLKFDEATTGTLLSLDCATNAYVHRVRFEGTSSWQSDAPDNSVSINLRGYSENLTTENVIIDDCEMHRLSYGVVSNYEVNNIVVKNSSFKEMYKGVAFNNPINTNTTLGPKLVTIRNNKFNKISAEGIYVGPNSSSTGSFVSSVDNNFVNVGNMNWTFAENWSTGTAIINFQSRGNSTTGDYFERETWQNINGGTVWYNPLVLGRSVIERKDTLIATVPALGEVSVHRLPITGDSQYIQMQYSLYADLGLGQEVDRMGTLHIYVRKNSGLGDDPQVHIDDEYNFNSRHGGVYWAGYVDADYNLIEIRAIQPATSAGGTGYALELRYGLKILT